MTQRIRFGIGRFGSLLAAWLAFSGLGGSAVSDTRAAHRWAVISADPQCAALAELLTAELSRWPDVELVERDQIKRVMDELQLQSSGLAEAAGGQRFGVLSHAEAILLLEKAAPSHVPGLRLRLVETRTSVRLLDVLLPAGDMETEVRVISEALKRGSSKLAIPEERRRYVGVLMVKSEEPGEALKPFCRTLTALVEAELQRRPEVIVLERGQLQRLTAERDLTGAELQLRSAARLLEAGVRRAEGNTGLVLACRWLSPVNGAQKTLRIESDSGEIGEVLAKLVASIDETLGASGPIEPRDLAAEAAAFSRRRDLFDKAYRSEDAAEMAEAALALAPTPKNLGGALLAYSSWTHSRDQVLRSHEALTAARRLAELRLAWFRKSERGSPMREAIDVAFPFRPHVRIPATPESPETRRLRAETDALCIELFETVYAEAADPYRRLGLLVHRLEYSAYLAETGREFAAVLPALLARIKSVYREIETPTNSPLESAHRRAAPTTSLRLLEDAVLLQPDQVYQSPKAPAAFRLPGYAAFARSLTAAVQQSSENCDRSRRSKDQREWELAEVLGLWKTLAADTDPATRAAGLCGLVTIPGDGAAQAAQELLVIVKDWPPIFDGRTDLSCDLAYLALTRLAGTSAEQEFVDRFLQEAEQQADARGLVRYSTVLYRAIGRAPQERARDWCQRSLKVLDRAPSAPADQIQSLRQASLRGAIEDSLKKLDLSRSLTPGMTGSEASAPSGPPFSPGDGPGPWPQYVARPVAILKDPQHVALATVFVDRRPDARQRGGELILAWTHRPEGLAVDRVGVGGGAPRPFGPGFPGQSAPFRGVQLAAGPDAIFAASGAPGIVTVRAEGVDVAGEQQGAPATEIFSLGWYKDRLYVGFRDAFASFDPAAKTFRLLASSISVEPRNDVDGRGSFFVTQILPDEEHDCLWLCIQDNALPRARNGIWRFSPERDLWQRLDENPVTYPRTDEISWGDDGLLWYLSHRKSWMQVAAGTARATALAGYAQWTPPVRLRPLPWRFVKVGSHIISGDGQLYTPDGAEHRLKIDVPWTLLQRVGPGFITHFDPKTNLLWYVEPKLLGDSATRVPSSKDTSNMTE